MKKTIAILLSILCAMPGMICTAFAEERADLPFLKALSIVDSNVSSKAVITRGDLAKIYYNILIQKPDMIGDSEAVSDFSDVEYELTLPVAVVSRAGIMNGVGGGYFAPGESVTYAQLTKTMVDFLGYRQRAQSYGGYPIGYYTAASYLKLTKNAPSDRDALVTFAGVEQLFLDAADIELFEDDDFDFYKDETFLTYYFDALTAEGVVTEDQFTDMDNNKSDIYGRIRINTVSMDVTESAKGLLELGGKMVKILYKDAKPRPKILYFEGMDNQTTVISGRDVSLVTKTKIEYTDGDKDKKLTYNAQTSVLYNGSALASYSLADLNPFDSADGSLTCIDNNADGILDVIYVSAYESMVVGAVKDGKVYSKIRSGQQIDLDDLRDATLLNSMGKPIQPDTIVENDIISYEKDKNGIVNKATVTIDNGTGKISEIEYDITGNPEKITMSGKTYTLSKGALQNKDIGELSVGSALTAYFDKESLISDFELLADEDLKTGLLVDFKSPNGLGTEYQVKILNAAGLFETYTLSEKVESDHTSFKAEKLPDYAGCAQDGRIQRQIIRYTVNQEGKLNTITLAGSLGLYQMDGFDGATPQVYRSELNTFGLKAYVDTNTLVFIMPPESDRDNSTVYEVKGSGIFGNGAQTVKAYCFEEESSMIKVVLQERETNQNVNFSKIYDFMVIENITQIIGKDEMPIYKISGYGRANSGTNAKIELYTDDMEILTFGAEKTVAATGDVLRVYADYTGKITKAEMVLDKSKDQLYNMSNPNTTFMQDARYSYGKVVHQGDGLITVCLKNADGSSTLESYPIFRFSTNGIYYQADKKGHITMGDYGAKYLFDSKNYGEEDASDCFVYVSGQWWIAGIIYND